MGTRDEERNQKTVAPSASTDGRGKDSFLLPDGREIINYRNPATIITVGFVSFVLLIGSTTLIGYRFGRNEVKQICMETIPGAKLDEDDPRSLRKRMYDAESGIIQCKSYDERIKSIEEYFKPKGKK